MNSEQLNAARLARWSQDGEARLTLEEITDWLGAIGFCLYLPVRGVAAPSFVEAVVGRPAPGPSAGERSRTKSLLTRLVEKDLAVPLKFSATVSEDADWIATPDVFRYIYALLGNRNFKGAPPVSGQDAVTPLALHCWQALHDNGPLDIAALKPIVGGDASETAVARALHELWTALYVFPLSGAPDAATQWDLLYRRWPKPVAAGTSTGHAEAQSALVTLFLQSIVAAPEEEILSFLSPLSPQSKLREVIRGLGSMRQLDIIDVDGRPHVCLQGSILPEKTASRAAQSAAFFAALPELPAPETPAPKSAPDSRESSAIRKFVPKRPESARFAPREPQRLSGDVPPRRFERTGPRDGQRSAGPKKFGERKNFGERKSFDKEKKFEERRSPRRQSEKFHAGERGVRRFPNEKTRFSHENPRSSSEKQERHEFSSHAERPGKSGGRPFSRERKPFDRKFADRKSFDRKSGGSARPSGFRKKPWPQRETKPDSEMTGAGRPRGSKPFRSKNADDFSRSSSGPRKPWTKRGNDFHSRSDDRPKRREGDESRGGERPRKTFGSKPFRPKNSTGGKRPFSGGRPPRPRNGKGGKRA